MEIQRKSLAIITCGIVLLAGGAYLTGNPRAPFGLGGVPRIFYFGVGSGYLVGGIVAFATNQTAGRWSFQRVIGGTLLSIPITSFLLVSFSSLGIGPSQGASDLLWFVLLPLGFAILFYPVAFGFAAGFATGDLARTMLGVGVLYLFGVAVLFLWYDPSRGFHRGFLGMGFAVAVVVVSGCAYPLYRLGQGVRSETVA